MLAQRFAVILDNKQLNSVTLGISHCIEQKYAQKLTDDEFGSLKKIMSKLHHRGKATSALPWHGNSAIRDGCASLINPPDGLTLTSSYELVKKNPSKPLARFIDYLLGITEKTNEQGIPSIFEPLDEAQRKQIHFKIGKVLEGNIYVKQKKELEALREKLH